MAAAKSHRYIGPFATEIRDRFDLELDEADVWGAAADGDAVRAEPRKPALGARPIRNPAWKAAPGHAGPRSLPVGVPDWSRILGRAYRPRAAAWAEDCSGGGWEEDDEEEERLPPHEYLARSRGASLSVHEGVGRTLKGRDLSRVRDAIWKQTGFED